MDSEMLLWMEGDEYNLSNNNSSNTSPQLYEPFTLINSSNMPFDSTLLSNQIDLSNHKRRGNDVSVHGVNESVHGRDRGVPPLIGGESSFRHSKSSIKGVFIIDKVLSVDEFLSQRKALEEKLEKIRKVLSMEEANLAFSIFSTFSDEGLELLFLYERWVLQCGNLGTLMAFILPASLYGLAQQSYMYIDRGFFALFNFSIISCGTFLAIFLAIYLEKLIHMINDMKDKSKNKESDIKDIGFNKAMLHRRNNLFVHSFRAVDKISFLYPILTAFQFLVTDLVGCPSLNGKQLHISELVTECHYLQNGLYPPFWLYAPCVTLVVVLLSGARSKRSVPTLLIMLAVQLGIFCNRLRYPLMITTVSTQVILAILIVFTIPKLDQGTRQSFLQTKQHIVALHIHRLKSIIELVQAEEEAKATKMCATEKLTTTLRISFPDYDTVSTKTRSLINKAIKALPKEAYDEIKKSDFAFDEFELERRLSSGGFCTVYRGMVRGRPCAIKSISANDALSYDAIEGLIQEVLLLSKLNHPNIVQTIGHCWSPHICLILEFVEKGTLNDLLSYRSLSLSWTDPLLVLASQIASALNYLHSFNPPILHRDIKTRNVLMADFRQCKLADFGLSIALEDDKVKRAAGTRRYCAPELLKGSPSSTEADVWSFGVCLWEMATRVHFPDREPKVTTLPDQLPYPLPRVIHDMIKTTLSMNPLHRPGFNEINSLFQQTLKEGVKSPMYSASNRLAYLADGNNNNSIPTNGNQNKFDISNEEIFALNRPISRASIRRFPSNDGIDNTDTTSLMSSSKGAITETDNLAYAAENGSDTGMSDGMVRFPILASGAEYDETAARFAAEIPQYLRNIQDIEVSALTSVESLQGLKMWGSAKNLNDNSTSSNLVAHTETTTILDSPSSSIIMSTTLDTFTHTEVKQILQQPSTELDNLFKHEPIKLEPEKREPVEVPETIPPLPLQNPLISTIPTMMDTFVPNIPNSNNFMTPPMSPPVMHSSILSHPAPFMSIPHLHHLPVDPHAIPNPFVLSPPVTANILPTFPSPSIGLSHLNYNPVINPMLWNQPYSPPQSYPNSFIQNQDLQSSFSQFELPQNATIPPPAYPSQQTLGLDNRLLGVLSRLEAAEMQSSSDFAKYQQQMKNKSLSDFDEIPLSNDMNSSSATATSATITNTSFTSTISSEPAFSLFDKYQPSNDDVLKTLQRLKQADNEFEVDDLLTKSRKLNKDLNQNQ